MHSSSLLAVATLLSTAAAVAAPVRARAPAPDTPTPTSVPPVFPTTTPTPPGRFYLKTQVKSGQTGKDAFDGLYLYAYHTGAGTNDAMLSSNVSVAGKAYQQPGTVPDTTGGTQQPAYFSVLFDLGSPDVPWQLVPQPSVNIYAGWQPVRINAGAAGPSNSSAFYLDDDNELEWTNTAGTSTPSSFDGWLVCQWWHTDIDNPGEPGTQLFFRVNGFGDSTPSSCADVNLVQEHIAVPLA
ncbi:hypothetical protein SPI_02215 [Niveomyces insectorum RCEF 264]|uniref:DUF7907 domain-containing protein n=1 Tax=Niveomyces insectorum RCEF 264 TaxID=1081102 RepID=A0A162KB10_9HYPO|nr:hypothetical protein SPI_02215 [Niveomyces insectorum RCEF 264]